MCRNKPIIMQSVAEVRNMTGICHVMTWSKLGCKRPVCASQSRSRMVLESNLRRFMSPSRCDERRCSLTVWSAAVKILNSESTMPQYHVVRIGQGDSSPEGKIEGQDPVDVRTPASRAACNLLVHCVSYRRKVWWRAIDKNFWNRKNICR